METSSSNFENEYVYIKLLDKLINRFILESKKFVEYAAFLYGTVDLGAYDYKSSKLVCDFEYFAFTKSTKTLISIRNLLKVNHNEDVYMLVRSIFENYLSCRYAQETENIDSFIFNPVNLALAYYNVQPDGKIFNREKIEVGQQENPSAFKTGLDKGYYTDFYDILSRYSHCNFGTIDCYTENNIFTIDKNSDPLLIRLFVVFVFSKIFELVVTVEGEDFPDSRTEKKCYQLVIESCEFQLKVMDYLNNIHQSNTDETLIYRNKRMKKLLKNMKRSLQEELGSVDKNLGKPSHGEL
ncbi:hypothetical protein BSK62_22075 [Paenibacillus odorifer]|uniref:hypothetical protein n=1 Tax=Paenibacillus odorifer TaxID=189426 RepID=UPI00096BE4D6|nr:hypothetical protein [Paenibacillus odorifer]OMD62998.1 hypothetical protein BSK62_22075 [Paenibacillus odorifer]